MSEHFGIPPGKQRIENHQQGTGDSENDLGRKAQEVVAAGREAGGSWGNQQKASEHECGLPPGGHAATAAFVRALKRRGCRRVSKRLVERHAVVRSICFDRESSS